jgi:hypothetical protein
VRNSASAKANQCPSRNSDHVENTAERCAIGDKAQKAKQKPPKSNLFHGEIPHNAVGHKDNVLKWVFLQNLRLRRTSLCHDRVPGLRANADLVRMQSHSFHKRQYFVKVRIRSEPRYSIRSTGSDLLALRSRVFNQGNRLHITPGNVGSSLVQSAHLAALPGVGTGVKNTFHSRIHRPANRCKKYKRSILKQN